MRDKKRIPKIVKLLEKAKKEIELVPVPMTAKQLLKNIIQSQKEFKQGKAIKAKSLKDLR
jgi:hypothetical protein